MIPGKFCGISVTRDVDPSDVLKGRSNLHREKTKTKKGNPMNVYRRLGITVLALLAWSSVAGAQSWQGLKNKANFNAGAMLLLSDGTVMVHSEQSNTQNWYKLTPDNTGSYINGTWKQLASLPSGYAPLYFASAVLPGGRVLVEGGEYNNGSGDWTNKGAIYNPVTNKWASVNPPSGWSTIGDAQSVVLANKKLMLANCCTAQGALFNATGKTWKSTGTGKADWNDEEGWTLLPSGNVLTVDAYVNGGSGTNSEIYSASGGSWSSAGNTPVQLWDSCGGSHEEGPDVMMADGTVFATGANGCGAGHTAIYNSNTGQWSQGPDFPNSLDIADGPGSWEINGNAVVMASPGVFNTGAVFLEWNGSTLTQISGPPNASSDSSFYGHFLMLPSGQLLFTDFSSDVEVFTPSGTYQSAWQPTITSVPSTITRGTLYQISGTQFNGFTQGSAYGDDFQDATNFALVRVVNNSTGHVFYCRTKNPSTMGIQTGSATVSTHFTCSKKVETGASSLYVVTNGIPSAAAAVTIQ